MKRLIHGALLLVLALAGCELLRDDGDSVPPVTQDYIRDTLGGTARIGRYSLFQPGTEWTYSTESLDYSTGITTFGTYTITILEASAAGLPIRCHAVFQGGNGTGRWVVDTLLQCFSDTATMVCDGILPGGLQLPFYTSDFIEAGKASEIQKEDTVRFEFTETKQAGSSSVFVSHSYQSNIGLVRYGLRIISGMGGRTDFNLTGFVRGGT